MSALYELIYENFTKDEIELLCRKLKVDYDEVARNSRKITAMNLQDLLRRRSETSLLLSELREQKPQFDYKPFLYHVIAEVFYTEEKMVQLLERFGFAARDFGGPEHLPWGSQPWREEKAETLQAKLEEDGRICDLLAAIRRAGQTVDLSFYDVDCEETNGPSPATTTPSTTEVELVEEEDGVPTSAREEADAYENFDISIQPQGDGRYYVEADCVAGQGGEAVALDLQSEELTELLAYMRGLTARPGDIERLGDLMRAFLFPGKVWELFVRSRDLTNVPGQAGLRIRLRFRLNQGGLMQLPWEYCRDDRDFFAVNSGTPMVRYLKTDRVAGTVGMPDTMRVMVAIASPSDQPQIDVEGEAQRITEALSNLQQEGRIDLRIVEHARQRDLATELTASRGFRPHIFHYVGHGLVLKSGEGALMLEDGAGKSDPTTAQGLLRMLRDRSSATKIVILNACLTAAFTSDEAIMGIAPRLVWGGLPAVVASQFAIPDSTAKAFAADFYGALAHGTPLDAAITEARRLASFDDARFWGIPVLFMRAPDGVIWE